MSTLLEVQKLEAFYGAGQVLHGIGLSIARGEQVALLGRNGMGKTTLLRSLMGLVADRRGQVTLNGRDIMRAAPETIARAGVALVPEGRGVFAALTIEENLAMGAYVRTDRDGVRADIERVFTLFPRLRERRRQTAGTLSGGEQQMLAIARAMMSRPRMLLLDEPSMGLAPLMVQKVFETILAVAHEGVTILLVEQNAKLALEVSDRGYVMEAGEITLVGRAADLMHDPKVRAAYLGEAA